MIGLDCEAIQNSASAGIGLLAATSAKPTAIDVEDFVLVRDESNGPGEHAAIDIGLKRRGGGAGGVFGPHHRSGEEARPGRPRGGAASEVLSRGGDVLGQAGSGMVAPHVEPDGLVALVELHGDRTQS